MSAQPAERRESFLSVAPRFIVILGIVLTILNLYAPANPPLDQRLMSSAIIVLGALPLAGWMVAGRQGIPFMPAIGAIYALYFGAPVLLSAESPDAPDGFYLVPDAAMERALMLSLIGISMLYLGYLLGTTLFKGLRGRRTAWTDASAPVIGGAVAALGLLIYLFDFSQDVSVGFGQALTLGSSLAVLGALILFAAWKQGRLSFPGRVYLFGFLVPIRVLSGFGTGANYQGFEIFVAFGLAAAALARKIPWKGTLVLLAVLILMEPVKAEFRDRVIDRSTGEYKNPLANTQVFVDTAQRVVAETTFSEALQKFTSRFGFIYNFAQVVDATPSRIPYWDGFTYRTFPSKLLPRILFPNKSTEDVGQTFGHRYEFIQREDTVTSINLAQLPEFYVNYGPWGVAIGMLLLGLLYRFIQQLVGADAGDVGAAVIGAYVLGSLLLIETNLSGVLAGTFYRLVFGLLIGRIMRLMGGATVFPNPAVVEAPGTAQESLGRA